MTICYLAAKYNASTDGARLRNTEYVIDKAIEIYESSHHQIYPIIPHLTHYMEKRMDYLGYPERSNDYWYAFDNLIIPKCDVLLKLSSDGESKGADNEEKLAKSLNIPIVYSVEELLRLHNEIVDYCSK